MAQFESLENLAETIENEGQAAVEQIEESVELHEEVDGDEDAEEVEDAAEPEEEEEEEKEAEFISALPKRPDHGIHDRAVCISVVP